eukprot:INCI9808.2.p1 GENE.INCI9808.2~~INCI9808.2.p1  ORF type:complete len:306 (-),score=58.29 INCI9808.2:1021-1938(-)
MSATGTQSTASGVKSNDAAKTNNSGNGSRFQQNFQELDGTDDESDSSEDLDYTADPLYDAKIDKQNEAWVLKHLFPPHLPQKDVPDAALERRIDRADGRAYTKDEFQAYYGGLAEWEGSKVATAAETGSTASGAPASASTLQAEAQAQPQPSPVQSSKQGQPQTSTRNGSRGLKKNPSKQKRRRKKKQTNFELSCPCCFSLLCVQCQQHELYSDQFRAAFARNCRVVMEEKIINRTSTDAGSASSRNAVPTDVKASASKDVQHAVKPSTDDGIEILHPVLCSECDTEVGVFDEDEIYHFFQVIPS